MRILKHPNYNPRLIEWLSRYTNVKGVPAETYQARVEWILEHPEELWRIAFEHQISEASRTSILALYSLGGKTHINRLEEAWRALHQYRSKKYNWKTAAEDWRQSLQDLEGGFLNFKDQHAEFVNPSVKDFLDTVLTQNVDHYNDLLAAACRFEQVVVLWNLVTSPKGKPLLEQITRSPDHVLSAMSQNLQRPHDETDLGAGGYTIRQLDVGPELRLQTLISLADHTRSPAALTVALDYAGTVIKLWEENGASYRAATEVLNVIDGAEWSAIATAGLHPQLKSTLLHSLGEWPPGWGIAAIADYASGQSAQWTEDDQAVLDDLAAQYLGNGFDGELGDCSNEGELQSLSENLDAISSCCGMNVTRYQDQINDRIGELPDPEPDDDGWGTRTWDRDRILNTNVNPEAEVKRLFEGLR